MWPALPGTPRHATDVENREIFELELREGVPGDSRRASLFYHADTMPYWRKRKNLPHVPKAVDPASFHALADLIPSIALKRRNLTVELRALGAAPLQGHL